MIAIVIILTILVALIIAFATWFFATAADGNCPICQLKALPFNKITMDVSKDNDYLGGSDTPIMGWSSWNTLRNHIDEDTIYDTARAMVDTGLADAGYKYINIDDCWQSSMRDENGRLQGDLETFPSGMDSLCKRINALGLKMGLYASNGTLTCEDLPASLGNEDVDAKTFASWGAEFFKYDYCHHEHISGKTPMIEFIDVSAKGERSSIKLTPERAKLSGRAKIVKVKELPTGKAIGFLNHNAGKAEFDINVDTPGEYVFTIHYKKLTSRKKQYLQIVVDGKLYEVFFPASIAFTADARLQALIRLNAGNNHIVLRNPVVTRADSTYIQYCRMGKALENATAAWAMFTNQPEKPITYSICEWGANAPWQWGAKAGNMWRTTHDIFPNWQRIVMLYNRTIKLYKYASPGHINDPDMLEVGNGKLSFEENKSHFTLWCMMAAPLVLGNDLRLLKDGSKKSNAILNIVTNPELIAIDQDPLVKPAKRIKKQGKVDIIARPLKDGDVALCLFNKGKSKKSIELELSSLKDEKYLMLDRTNSLEIHDLWTNDIFHSDSIKAQIAGHGVKAYRISKINLY